MQKKKTTQKTTKKTPTIPYVSRIHFTFLSFSIFGLIQPQPKLYYLDKVSSVVNLDVHNSFAEPHSFFVL